MPTRPFFLRSAACPLLFLVLLLLPSAFCLLPSSFAATPAMAPAPAPAREAGVSPDAMNRSVRDVLNRREFTWRNPRPLAAPEAKDQQPSAFGRFLRSVGEKIGKWFETLRRWFHRDEKPPASEPAADRGGPTFGGIGLQPLLYGLLALCAVAVVILLVRGWQARRAARDLAGNAAPAASVALPDLTDEAVLADQLPEDEWLSLARRLLERGERRLALRAFYLSALSNLGGRGLLGIARHKSNRDYQGELRRRARDRAGLQETFGRLVARFERVWYGSHPADDTLLTDFQNDRAQIAAELPA